MIFSHLEATKLILEVALIDLKNLWPLVVCDCTTTRIESCLSTGERSVIRSIEQLANGLVDFTPSVGMYDGFAGAL